MANSKKKVTVELTSLTEAEATTFLGELDTLLGSHGLSREDSEAAYTEYAGDAGIYMVMGTGRHARLVACDFNCDKAFGPTRTQEDGEWLSDSELGTAPADPGTEARGQKKPVSKFDVFNLWCREKCERCVEVTFWTEGSPPQFPDFSSRVPVR